MSTQPSTPEDLDRAERFGLARVISQETGWEWDAANGVPAGLSISHDLALAILTAGYRKPRMIATVEELDALPPGSVVRCNEPEGLDDFMVVAERRDGGWTFPNSCLQLPSHASTELLPATVLYNPNVYIDSHASWGNFFVAQAAKKSAPLNRGVE